MIPCIGMKLITWPSDVERRHTWSCTNCTVTVVALILCRFPSFPNASDTRAVLFNSSESMLITSQHMLHCSLRYEIYVQECVKVAYLTRTLLMEEHNVAYVIAEIVPE